MVPYWEKNSNAILLIIYIWQLFEDTKILKLHLHLATGLDNVALLPEPCAPVKTKQWLRNSPSSCVLGNGLLQRITLSHMTWGHLSSILVTRQDTDLPNSYSFSKKKKLVDLFCSYGSIRIKCCLRKFWLCFSPCRFLKFDQLSAWTSTQLLSNPLLKVGWSQSKTFCPINNPHLFITCIPLSPAGCF